nr:IclR family transcriptional regulator C-terminal domain-containing protein [Haloterrigena salifodinae]
MLANMSWERVAEIIAEKGLPAVTEETITDEERFFRHLETAREDGYATIRGERVPELGSIAVPVKKNGTVFGAVSVCCPMSRASDERFEEELSKHVLEAANRITLDLKYS